MRRPPSGRLAYNRRIPPVFGPKFSICGILPGLGMPPFDLAATQNLSQMFQRNQGGNLLSHQILPQFGQRPDGHADQLLGRRQCNLTDLFDALDSELMRFRWSATVRIPCDSVDTAVVEAVDDASYPRRRTVAQFGDPGVFYFRRATTK